MPGWLEQAHRFYVGDLVAHAGLSRAHAEAKAGRDYATLFPGGTPVDGLHALVVENAAGATIGRLLFAERPAGVWLYEIELVPEVRGRGLGHAAMEAFEERARALGARSVTLNVFAGNEVARSLYRSLGYVEDSLHLRKRLS